MARRREPKNRAPQKIWFFQQISWSAIVSCDDPTSETPQSNDNGHPSGNGQAKIGVNTAIITTTKTRKKIAAPARKRVFFSINRFSETVFLFAAIHQKQEGNIPFSH